MPKQRNRTHMCCIVHAEPLVTHFWADRSSEGVSQLGCYRRNLRYSFLPPQTQSGLLATPLSASRKRTTSGPLRARFTLPVAIHGPLQRCSEGHSCSWQSNPPLAEQCAERTGPGATYLTYQLSKQIASSSCSSLGTLRLRREFSYVLCQV